MIDPQKKGEDGMVNFIILFPRKIVPLEKMQVATVAGNFCE